MVRSNTRTFLMTDVTILGQIRGAVRQYFTTGQQIQPVMSDGGALIMTQGLPERAELVKLGASYGAVIPTANAFTYPTATWPTTRSELILQNAELAIGP